MQKIKCARHVPMTEIEKKIEPKAK